MIEIYLNEAYAQAEQLKAYFKNEEEIVFKMINKKDAEKQFYVDAFTFFIIENTKIIASSTEQKLSKIIFEIKKLQNKYFLNQLFLKLGWNIQKTPKQKINNIALIIGLCINLLLMSTKLILGLQFHMVALISDSLNHFTDLLNNLLVFFGIKLSLIPPDKKHPYGHGRIEYIANIFLAVFILFVGWGILRHSVHVLLHPIPLTFHYLILLVLMISIFLKTILFFVDDFIGSKAKLEILHSMAIDAKNDVYISLGILISLLLYNTMQINLDGLMGIVIALLIIRSGIEMLLKMVNHLIGIQHDTLLETQIKQALHECAYTLGIHDLVLHSYGSDAYFGSVHVEVDAFLSISELHDAYDNIEKQIKQQCNVMIVIHLDPINLQDERRLSIRKLIKQTVAKFYHEYDLHDFRLYYQQDKTTLTFELSVDYAYQSIQKEVYNNLLEVLEVHTLDEINIIFEYR